MAKWWKSHERWLDESNLFQQEWTMNYLKQNNLRVNSYEPANLTPYQAVLYKLNEIPLNDHSRQQFSNMRIDWTRSKRRENPDFVIHNMELSKAADSKLKSLAKGKPLNKTLEDIILLNYEAKLTYQTELKAIKDNANTQLKKHKETLTDKYVTKNNKVWKTLYEGKIGKELSVSKESLTMMSIKLYNLLEVHSQYQIKLQEHGLKDYSMTDEQKKMAANLFDSLKNEYLGKNLFTIESLIENHSIADQNLKDMQESENLDTNPSSTKQLDPSE